MYSILKKINARCVLLCAIRFYRARLSQRGPLKRVCCTFSAIESCSAYAERVAQELPVHRAIMLTIGRLARCRDFSVYRFGDGRLGWERGFDRVLASHAYRQQCCQLNHDLMDRRETCDARQAILSAADAMRWGRSARQLKRQRCRLAIRNVNSVVRHLQVRLLRLTLQMILSGYASLIFAQWGTHLATGIAAGLMVVTICAAIRTVCRLGRLGRQRILSQLEIDTSTRSMHRAMADQK